MFSIEDLYADKNSNFNNEAVDYFVSSEYPNSYFLQQFYPPYSAPFYHKKYWEAFAQILIRRGLPKINDVKCDILQWLKDVNWSGCTAITQFILSNRSCFQQEILNSIYKAYKEKDIIWFKNLLVVFFQKNSYALEIVEYLDDDCWKDFDTKYGIENTLKKLQ
jgi:hypothetical protein